MVAPVSATERLTCDVAILGGGLAGSLLARQLRRTLPQLRIAVFEKSTVSSYKVGESTVEIASNYLIRRLGLSTYLYDRHLPKNGLRFFFDTPEKNAELHEMTEVGTVSLPFHPSFQINRARLESDLWNRNRADGITVRTGVRASDLELGADGAQHRFAFAGDGREGRCECRWLVDAAGRASLIARAKGLRIPEAEHSIAAVWGRFTEVRDLDDFGPESFRARVRNSSRMLSTVHFCYPGDWIWFIPLKDGVTSVGVVGERSAVDTSCRTKTGFLEFLGRHRAVSSLLEGARMRDIGSYAQLAYGTSRYFSADRWGMTGEAAAFADPFYSPGSDYIALENDFLTDLIRRDVGGEDAEAFRARVELYDEFMRFRHEAAMLLYRGLYSILGSYEVYMLKWELDIASYYNLWVAPYMRDEHLDEAFLRTQLREKSFILQALRNFADLFRKVENRLRERGQLHRMNLGGFSQPLRSIDYTAEIGTPCSREEVLARTAAAFNAIRGRALDLLDDAPAAARPPLPLPAFMTSRPLA
jgi:flavin-dependent dehydrogenase